MWFLLVPYFAVASLNVLPWIGETRENANRTNAQLTIALIFASAVFGILGVTGAAHRLHGARPIWVGVACIVPPMVAISLFFNREREHQYRTAYKTMPTWERGAFGLGTLAFVAAMFWLFFTASA